MSRIRPATSVSGQEAGTSVPVNRQPPIGDTQIAKGQTPNFVDSLLSEMRSRWEQGERPLCDDYLQLINPHALTEQVAVDLIYSEYSLRLAHGLPATPASFLARFPEYREALQRQFDLDFALDPSSSAPQSRQDSPAQDHPLLANRPFPISLGRYMAVAMIDGGGQAEILLGIHPTLRKNVILKLGRRPVDANFDSEEILQEGRILASLDHENLVPVYDVELIDGYPLIVMDYVSGRSLEQTFRNQRPSVPEALRLMGAMTKAVAYIHRQNLLHLDIKPRNIVIDANGNPRLIDFGLARLDDVWNQKSISDQVSGTLQYMAPEQLSGDRDRIGPQADLFALGGVFHFLLTGSPPYSGTTMQALVEQVQKGSWDQSSLDKAAVPAAVRELCTQALAFDPAQRFASASEMAEEINAAALPRKSVHAASLLLLIPLIWFLFVLFRIPKAEVAPIALDSPAETMPTSPEMQLNVWDENQLKELDESHLPLVNGDELRIRLKLPARQQGVLLACDGESGWSVLRTWDAGDRTRSLVFPGDDATVPLTGAPGTHVLLFCTARDVRAVSEHFTRLPKNDRLLAPISPYSVVSIMPEESRLDSFGKGFGIPIEHPTAESEVLKETQTLRQIAQEQSASVVGIVFWKE